MSDTPRTDAACEGVSNQNWLSPFVPASVARNLERELAAALAKLDEATNFCICAYCKSRIPKDSAAAIGLKAGEEAGEVLAAIVKMSEGRATHEDLEEEIGDLLIVLSQMAAKQGTTLEELRRRRFEAIRRRNRLPKRQ